MVEGETMVWKGLLANKKGNLDTKQASPDQTISPSILISGVRMNDTLNTPAKYQRRPWVNLALFEDENDARLGERFLWKNALEARTYNDRWLQMIWFLCLPHATYRVQVRRQDLKRAEEFINTETPAVMLKAIRCPSCHSLHVNYPQMTRKFLLPTIVLHLGILLRVIEHECYCEHCHHIWNLPAQSVPVVAQPARQP